MTYTLLVYKSNSGVICKYRDLVNYLL